MEAGPVRSRSQDLEEVAKKKSRVKEKALRVSKWVEAIDRVTWLVNGKTFLGPGQMSFSGRLCLCCFVGIGEQLTFFFKLTRDFVQQRGHIKTLFSILQ